MAMREAPRPLRARSHPPGRSRGSPFRSRDPALPRGGRGNAPSGEIGRGALEVEIPASPARRNGPFSGFGASAPVPPTAFQFLLGSNNQRLERSKAVAGTKDRFIESEPASLGRAVVGSWFDSASDLVVSPRLSTEGAPDRFGPEGGLAGPGSPSRE